MYVTNRRSVSYFAQRGNQYSPNGVNVMEFNLTGDQWLDPGAFRVMFQLNNKDYGSAGSIHVQPLSWNPAVRFQAMPNHCWGSCYRRHWQFQSSFTHASGSKARGRTVRNCCRRLW